MGCGAGATGEEGMNEPLYPHEQAINWIENHPFKGFLFLMVFIFVITVFILVLIVMANTPGNFVYDSQPHWTICMINGSYRGCYK
jgi:hypothetical protein